MWLAVSGHNHAAAAHREDPLFLEAGFASVVIKEKLLSGVPNRTLPIK